MHHRCIGGINGIGFAIRKLTVHSYDRPPGRYESSWPSHRRYPSGRRTDTTRSTTVIYLLPAEYRTIGRLYSVEYSRRDVNVLLVNESIAEK